MNPARLRDDAELGPLVQALESESFDPQRLARVRRAVVAGEPPLRPAGGGLRLTLVAGLVAAGATAVVLSRDRQKQPATEPAAVVAPTDDLVITEPGPAPAPAVSRGGRRAAAAPPSRPAPSAAVEPAAPPPRPLGDLAEHLRRWDEARAFAARGDVDRALAAVETLRRDYPATPLAPEIDLARADWLARAGRRAQAVDAIVAILAANTHPGKRRELERLHVELLVRLERCAEARERSALLAADDPLRDAAIACVAP